MGGGGGRVRVIWRDYAADFEDGERDHYAETIFS